MERIKVGIIGMGFMGTKHIEAIKRIGMAELVGVSDVNYELAKAKAQEYNVKKCYSSADQLINDKEINVIHNCTTNNLHLEINEKVIKSGKHIFSEKPLGKTSDDTARLVRLLKHNNFVVHGVNFNYRMNPLVMEMKHKIENGEIGSPKLVYGSYLQDWLLFDTDYNWRIERDVCGPSRCMADIGSHWIDCVQTVLNARIIEVCADLETILPIRKKPKGVVETFSTSDTIDYEEKRIDTEDYGAVLFKMDSGVKGVFYASQVSAGRKCYLNFEVGGTKSSLYWNQENSERMWMGFRDKDNCIIMRNPEFMCSDVRKYTSLPAGHPEGWNDALKNNINSFYKFIVDGKKIGEDQCDFATFEDGHYVTKVIEAILESSKIRQWVKVS